MKSSALDLQRECQVFTEYLLGCSPNNYVVKKYVDAHQIVGSLAHGTAFDQFLVRGARRYWLLTKLADSYARIFASRGLLRKKLVLLLAILETCPPFFQAIDAVDSGSKLKLMLRLTCRGGMAAMSLAAAAVVLVPAQVLLGRFDRKEK